MEQLCEEKEYILAAIQREEIIKQLREHGCRITKQREALLDVILQRDCSCCKEVYYLASKKMPHIGMATIYRMVNSLEDIGAIKRRSMYRLHEPAEEMLQECKVILSNGTVRVLDAEEICEIVQKGMKECGYLLDGDVLQVVGK